MNPLFILVPIMVVCAIYVAWVATRLTRLHRRTEGALCALTDAAHTRATVAHTWAETHSPETSDAETLRHTAAAVLTALDEQDATPLTHEAQESALTRAIRTIAYTYASAQPILAAHRKLAVARQVYNDAVRDTLALRRARIPRALRLSTGRPRPGYFDTDLEL